MDRHAFVNKQSPRQLDEIWEMEEEAEKSKRAASFTAEEERVQHNGQGTHYLKVGACASSRLAVFSESPPSYGRST